MRRIKDNDMLRIKLSISQQDFAQYLGITRSQLTMFEQGLRSMPTPALLKLANLEIVYHNNQQEKNKKLKTVPLHPQLQKHNEKTKKQMRDQAEFCHAKRAVLQHQIEEMAKEHAKAQTWSQLLDKMLLDISGQSEKKQEYSWFLAQKAKALTKMIRFGMASQSKLQAAIHLLEAEAWVYKSLHEKL